jgi:hypothetical protein
VVASSGHGNHQDAPSVQGHLSIPKAGLVWGHLSSSRFTPANRGVTPTHRSFHLDIRGTDYVQTLQYPIDYIQYLELQISGFWRMIKALIGKPDFNRKEKRMLIYR